MKNIHSCIISTPISSLKVEYTNNCIEKISFSLEKASPELEDPLMIDLNLVLEQYFSGQPMQLGHLPLAPAKTDFAKQIRKALLATDYAKTYTYGELAAQLHSHPRAVGQACRNNPFPILVPCHRIVGKASPGGFAGAIDNPFFHLKQKLINFETLVPGTNY